MEVPPMETAMLASKLAPTPDATHPAGATRSWTDPRLVDHVIGLELQLDELRVESNRLRQAGATVELEALELRVAALRREVAQSRQQVTPSFGPVVIRAPQVSSPAPAAA